MNGSNKNQGNRSLIKSRPTSCENFNEMKQNSEFSKKVKIGHKDLSQGKTNLENSHQLNLTSEKSNQVKQYHEKQNTENQENQKYENLNRQFISNGNEGEFEHSVPSIIKKKRDKNELNESEINFLVKAISDNSMEDSQLGAFLMSVYVNGMTSQETADLTKAMKNSGTCFEWPSNWVVVDKHSTGGVGDKVSLVLAPALASCGLKVPMISGRGLGHTGGTLDKLESIPGFRISLSEAEIKGALETVGCCIVGQTSSLVPADKRMYSIRDVTATVNSVPLIVSSIISKKACESLKSLVLDVKYGSGSFMKTQEEAQKLANALTEAGNLLGIHTNALVTSNESPIGKTVGNALEVEESIGCLRGNGPADLEKLVVSLGAQLLVSSSTAKGLKEGEKLITSVLHNGQALSTFNRMLQAQGVDEQISNKLCGEEFDKTILPQARMCTPIFSSQSGTITKIDAMTIAEVCLHIGAGRMKSSDAINHAVGIVLHKCVGNKISAGELLGEIKHDTLLDESLAEKAKNAVLVDTTSI